MTRCERLQSVFVSLFSMLFLQVVLGHAQIREPNTGSLYLDRLDTGAGAELLTLVSASTTGRTEPVISILRDTLGDGDPANDKIRYVWVLGHSRPTLKQRLQAGLPFFHRRSGAPVPNEGKPPDPTLDYSATGHRALRGVLGRVLQAGFLDSNGVWLRATTRSYRDNAAEYRNTRIAHSLAAISKPASRRELPGLSSEDFDRILGRLVLAQRFLGDVVRESSFVSAKQQHDLRSRAARASNWDLLRQKAEENGLYFQELRLESQEPSHVLLWVAREDLAAPQPFDDQFLQISSPWGDDRVEKIGYSETWYFDSDSRRVEAGSPGSRAVEMIPLGLFSLNHPKAPLLIVDFRKPGKVGLLEMCRSAVDDATSSVFALSAFGNWTYLGIRSAWNFFRGRRGAPIDRQARLNAYSGLRRALPADTSLDPQLRGIIAQSVDSLSVNPFERSLKEEAAVAEQQYQGLIVWARSPEGLAAQLDRERREEMVAAAHGKAVRGLFTLARIATFGLYHHREQASAAMMDRLDRRRRTAFHMSRLKEILDSSPRIEVVANIEQVRESLEALTVLSEQDAAGRKEIAKLVARVFKHTEDERLRRQSVESLARIQGPEAAMALAGLVDDAGSPALDPLAGGPEPLEENLNLQDAEDP